MEISLDLKKYCVRRAMKCSYDRAVSEYFRKEEKKPELEEKIELLSMALSKIDFPALRTKYTELIGCNSTQVILSKNSSNEPCMVIDGQPVDITPFIIKKIIA